MNISNLFTALTQGLAQAAKPRQIGQAMGRQASPAAVQSNNREIGVSLSGGLQPTSH